MVLAGAFSAVDVSLADDDLGVSFDPSDLDDPSADFDPSLDFAPSPLDFDSSLDEEDADSESFEFDPWAPDSEDPAPAPLLRA